MEIEELKNIWQQYDVKLNNLEKLNKKLIMETLSKKPQRRINYHRFQSMYGLFAVPIILIIVLHPYFKMENIDWKFITGLTMALSVVIYLGVINFKSYILLKGMNLCSDPIIESAKKVMEYKKHLNNRWKHAIVYYPVVFSGFILITWKSFTFDTQTILSLIAFFIVTYIINIIAPKTYHNKAVRLEKEILELKEYSE